MKGEARLPDAPRAAVRAAPERERAAWGLLAGGWALAAVAVARWLPGVAAALPSCPFRAATGLPCPTCGATRALLALACGEPGQAFLVQPAVTVGVVAAVLAGAASAVLLLLPRFTWSLPTPDPRRAAAASLIALLVNWGYLLLVKDASW